MAATARERALPPEAALRVVDENTPVRELLSTEMLSTADSTRRVSQDALRNLDVPRNAPSPMSLPTQSNSSRREESPLVITDVPPNAERVEAAARVSAPQRARDVFDLQRSAAPAPHYALPLLNLGLAYEQFQTGILQKSEQEIMNCERTTRELLDLSKQLQQFAVEEEKTHTLPSELKAALVRMKLLTEEVTEIDHKRAKLIDSKISGELSAEKMKMEIASMKPQKIMALIKAIHEVMQAALRYKRQEDQTITQNTRR